MTLAICIAIYFAIPVLSIWISGRQVSVRGWAIFLFIWPIGWLIFGPEELP